MPIKSKAQQRLMYAAASKRGGIDGVSQKVGKEFTETTPKSAYKHMPAFKRLKSYMKKKRGSKE